MKKSLLLTCLSLLVHLCTAQTSQDFFETNNAKKSLRHAQQLINGKKYKQAIRQLKHTIKIKDNFAVAYRELGRVMLEVEDLAGTIEALEKSFDLDDKLSRAAFFECGEAYFQLSDMEKAKYYYQRYREMKGQSYVNRSKESGMETGYDILLQQREENIAFIEKMDTSGVYAYPIHLSDAVNSVHDDYLPTITSDGAQLVFTRQGKAEDENVMISLLKKDQWQKARSFGKSINTQKNEGMAKFEAHGKSFYFAGCMRADTEGGCDIYQATLSNGEVEEVRRLEGSLNSHFWDSQPAITCDGQMLFFSSSRDGGLGGADIWVSRLDKNGEWSSPQNLGAQINTPGDEEAPFISSDGKTLYFSSTTLPGQGDGDLFMSRFEGGKWSQPINLGFPINSPAKELGFYVQGDGKTAYFSSARKDGEGGLDIYQIELPESLRPDPIVHLQGHVVESLTFEPLTAQITIGREGQKWQVQTDEKGWFFLCLPGNKGYSFQIEKDGYEYYVGAQYLEAQDNAVPADVIIELIPVAGARPEFVAKGVGEITEKRVQFFFDFDSHFINERTASDLRALVGLLQEEEDWKVEIVGYADQSGDVTYNQALSEKRARAISNYLKRNGITINKVIRNEGMGSIGDSTNQDDAQQFRRVDVILRK
ncbi:MAG: OmpA family protein [Bacteroidota bacterium]